MFVVTNRVPVVESFREQFEERFRQRAGQVEKQPGFIRMEIMRPIDEDSPYLVMTTWQDEEAFNNWVGSEDFKLAHQNPLPKEAYKTTGGGMEQH
ncbi:MAG: antibiotic biosynthesis monooxygenase, partial [Gammaproteobacteria bacterium]